MLEKIQRKFARWLYKKLYGYYPIYPSLFVSGMVGVDTLKFRRAMLLIVHYLSVLHGRIDDPGILAEFRISVPTVSWDSAGLVAPRRRPRLLALPVARTQRGRHAPTNHALHLFADCFGHIICNQFIKVLNDITM
ncbi:hypothetical protein ABMA28_001901 [Loxostege sticticalis]|uniref:Uncharacterized protein n=1 Tax=Loxostege sticticalis TaxID=481309 RepID=A0ABD0SZA2_LOXSC